MRRANEFEMMRRKQRRLPAPGGAADQRLPRQAGFSMMELLVVIAVILLLSAIAAPTLVRAIRSYRTETTARGVANMLQRARYEAVNRGQRVSTIFVPPAGPGQSPMYGIDVNRSGALDPGEPRIVAESGVTFWRNNAPTLPPVLPGQLPADYTTVGVGVPGLTPPFDTSPPYSVHFSPQGTVVHQQGGAWQLAPQVQAICFIQGPIDAAGNPTSPRDFEAWLVTVTPAGGVRVWRWNNQNQWY